MAINNLQRHPFLRLLMPLVVGVLCGDAFPHALPLWVILGGFLFVLVAFIAGRRYYSPWLYGVAVHSFLFGLGFNLVSRQLIQTDYTFINQPSIYKIRIQEKPEIKERSILCRSILVGEYQTDTLLHNSRNNLFLLYFPKDSATSVLKRGDELLIHAHLSPPINNGNPDEFDYVRYLKRHGGSGTAYVSTGHWKRVGHDDSRTLRQVALDCREQVVALYRKLGFSKDELAVLSALTVGDKEDLSEDIVETYSVAGASHVLALSGLHIGFLYALLWFIMCPLWKRCSILKPFFILLLITFLWSFAFLTGLSSSVVRSVIMFSLLALAQMQLEKPLTMNTLAATAFLMLLYNPTWLFDVGFQLSFVSVAAIVAIQPRIYALWTVKNRFLRYVWGLISVSVAAQVGTAPLVVLYFSRFSTHFLLANLWVIPMVSLILYSAVFLLILTPFTSLQQVFAGLLEQLVHMQNAVLRWIEQLPFASVDGIWVDIWEVLLFYLLIMLFYRSTLRCTVRRVYLSLFALLFLVSYHSVSTALHAPRRGFVFYNIRGCPAVHCLTNGSQSWLACADSLQDVSRLHRSLSSYWNRLRLEEPSIIKEDYVADYFFYQNQILSYAGKQVCFLHDARWRNKTSAHPICIDYLYISKGYTDGIKELSSLFSVKTVVLDSSLSVSFRDRIINECIRLGISYLSLSDKGSVYILL